MRSDEHHPPTYNDADLVLRLYELRRDPVLRESRASMVAKFWPSSFEELMQVTKADHPLNAAYRQTTSYWELAYSIARYGIVNPDFLMESGGEGLLIFARVHPYLDQLRATFSPRSFRNAEWIATNCDAGRQIFGAMQQRVAAHFASK